MDTVLIKGVLFNSPTSDQNLGVISGGVLGDPPGFDYEVGGLAQVGCSWLWGPDDGSPYHPYGFMKQFQGVDLAPGQTLSFVHGRCAPPAAGFVPGIFQVWGERQLFESSVVGRPPGFAGEAGEV
jgi:hypothetical protein